MNINNSEERILTFGSIGLISSYIIFKSKYAATEFQDFQVFKVLLEKMEINEYIINIGST